MIDSRRCLRTAFRDYVVVCLHKSCTNEWLTGDRYVLTVDGTYGEAPGCDGKRGCCKYAACDPVTSDPTGKTWACSSHGACGTGSTWGRSAVADRYPTYHCKDPNQPWCAWKFNASKLLGGFWYSTLTGGDCNHLKSGASECSWMIKEVVKTVNASCVNTFLHKAVESAGSQCFSGETLHSVQYL